MWWFIQLAEGESCPRRNVNHEIIKWYSIKIKPVWRPFKLTWKIITQKFWEILLNTPIQLGTWYMAPLGAVKDAALPLLLMKVPLASAMMAGSWTKAWYWHGPIWSKGDKPILLIKLKWQFSSWSEKLQPNFSKSFQKQTAYPTIQRLSHRCRVHRVLQRRPPQ